MENKKGKIKSQAKIKFNENRGITLIALVIMIIILVTLSIIIIKVISGDSAAKKAKEHPANATTPAGIEVKAPSKWTSTKVTAISDGSGNAVPLPDGFYYVGGNRKEGLVISDNSNDKDKGTSYATASTLQGNQFVWIPVDSEEDLRRTNFDANGQPTSGESGDGSVIEVLGCSEPFTGGYSGGNGTQEATDFNTMKTQVLKYNGFYIGRYEAGDATAGTALRIKVTTDHTVVCKKGVAPYNYIPWGESMSDINTVVSPTDRNFDNVTTHGAVYLSKNMYAGKEQAQSVTSNLCYGSQWDAMCRYIGEANRTAPKKSAPGLTGNVEKDVSKNIYDLAGNCIEWTMETDRNAYRVKRGGFYYSSDESAPYRASNITAAASDITSFRLGLYVKD